MGRAVFPLSYLASGQTMEGIVKVMATPSKDLYMHCCIQCPWSYSRPLLTHASAGDSWTLTALSNSMKLWAMPWRATQNEWVMVGSYDKMWCTGEGKGKPLQYLCHENPMNSMKRQKDMTLKDELPRSVGAQYATREEWRNKSRRMKVWNQSKNNTQVWMWLVMEVKSNAVKSNIV